MSQLFFLIIFLLLPLAQPCWSSQIPLRIVTEHWPPITYEKSGAAEGMAVDLARMIQKSASLTQSIEVLPWPRAYHLAVNQPDVLLFTVVRNPEREKLFTLIGPIANGEIAIYVRGTYDLGKVTLQSLKKELRIATHRGTAFHNILEQEGFRNIVPVNSSVNAVKMLMTGRVDAICDDELAVAELFRRAGYTSSPFVKVLSLSHSSLYFAFSRGTAPLTITKWKTAFEEIKRTGQFDHLYKKWFLNLKAPAGVHISLPPPHPVLKLVERPAKTPRVAELLKFQPPDLK
ncbi:substrate-binding periplasmic protein [Bdellovibrio bacteriovorus]|uniref:Putative ABC amino acid transporter solute binding protein n=1 Tax=Bdellovibrio bacteriovorus str. Tiberius TaxID=1069642 RepID=K7ZGH3_BDEBC|nr:transporter substrate-binding domain-containing protein [Bdellovibrio bacteriovorus]AFY02477.1 putative ABC amino acid transporter solute binding protein [Bdellovibrio bacteriovorus str. Tiberius]